MSFSERAILWLHIGVAIFAIGPVTAAIMSTPRYIRKRDAVIVGYLYRATRLYAIASLLVFVFGIVLADMLNELSKPWLSISMTLYVVAIVLLVLILRDQRKAVAALDSVTASPSPAVPPSSAAGVTSASASDPGTVAIPAAAPAESAEPDETTDAEPDTAQAAEPAYLAEPEPENIADVERGRIASLAGITGLIWLVILVLMIWR